VTGSDAPRSAPAVGCSGASILVVEDERTLADLIGSNLEQEGYQVELAFDGAEGFDRALSRRFDLLILDVMLPELDGFAVCQRLRSAGKDVAVLFLTAKADANDRIHGLEVGGDDYLPKPFHLKELLLRVTAILRRNQWYSSAAAQSSVLSFGDNEFDFRSYKGYSWDSREQSLTHKEAMILKVLSEHEDEVITREQILEQVWGYDIYPSTRVIDSLIGRLRQRFEPDPDVPRYFHTVRGVGYRFTRSAKDAV